MTTRLLPAVPANTLDRAIGWLSPGWAVKRQRDRTIMAMSGAYSGARSDRTSMQGWYASHGSANADLMPDLDLLRRRSRDLERNAPIASGAISTGTTNVVGTGLVMMPRLDREVLGLSDEAADRWERSADRLWRLWAESPECDLSRTQTFAGIQSLSFRSTLVNGDIFVVLRFVKRNGSPFGLKLQLIEADRVSNPRGVPDGTMLSGGVELDTDGAPAAYHMTNRHPGDFGPFGLVWNRVPAFAPSSGRRAVLHLFERRRVGQARGVPYLAPVIETLRQMTRYTDAEIMAAVVNSCFAITTKTEDGNGLGMVSSDKTDAKGDQIRLVDPGQIVDLGLNEMVDGFTPGRPNAQFDPFMLAVLRQVGVALELPFEVLVKHFTASYSAARAALLEAWKFFRVRRAWLTTALCQEVYEAFLIEAVARDMIDAPGFFDDPLIRKAWSGAEWVGPGPGQINELDETSAAEKRIQIGLTTLEEETARITGGDWEKKHAQRAKEHRLRVEAGLEPAVLAPVNAGAAAQRPPDKSGPASAPDEPEQEDAA